MLVAAASRLRCAQMPDPCVSEIESTVHMPEIQREPLVPRYLLTGSVSSLGHRNQNKVDNTAKKRRR